MIHLGAGKRERERERERKISENCNLVVRLIYSFVRAFVHSFLCSLKENWDLFASSVLSCVERNELII